MIRVRVFRREGRPYFEAQWEDPVTGRKKTRSTKKTIKRDAERFAAKLEDELARGVYRDPARTTWEDARKLYEAEAFPVQSPRGRRKMLDTFSIVERVTSPARLAGFSEDQIAAVCQYLRVEKQRTEATVKGHLVNIRRFLRWAHRRRLLERIPQIDVPARVTPGMRGRAPTAEEFERMLTATADVVGAEAADEWKRLLRGLWLSGLRLGEALVLHWTDDSGLSVELDGKRPMFRIQAHAEKGRRFRLLPMTPDFYRFLQEIPRSERRGLVFKPLGPQSGRRPLLDWWSKMITKIGRKANVKVSERHKRPLETGGEPVVTVKWASAHDLRRAFGFRWSTKVRAPLLMQLMRHESITTTLQFYVGRDAEAAADELWRDEANEFANTRHSEPQKRRQQTS